MLLASACIYAKPLLPSESIDAEVHRLMAEQDVKGLALAVIDDGEIRIVEAYGFRNVERGEPLDVDTVMYGASFTKTAFAYLVLQLVDEGRFDLDRPLHEYLARPIPEHPQWTDLADDDRWQTLTARHVLNHTTGFHNFRWFEPDRKLRFHYDPGERYGYSGEGFRLLQFTLEQGLGIDIHEAMQAQVFERFGMKRTSMTWRDDFRSNLSDSYDLEGKIIPHDMRDSPDAAGSMDTTIADQARMWAGILAGEGLSPESRSELVRPQQPIFTAHQFPSLITETDPRGPEVGLSAGLGLVTFNSGDGLSWFKGGHDEGTGNFAVCQEVNKRCVVLMSNSVRAELIYPQLVNFILPGNGVPWWWEYHLAD